MADNTIALLGAEQERILALAADVVACVEAGRHSGLARGVLDTYLAEIGEARRPRDPLAVVLDARFSPLVGGCCRMDNRVTAWLKDADMAYETNCAENYDGPMHMDSGSDPRRIYTFTFRSAMDARLFVAAMVNDFRPRDQAPAEGAGTPLP